MVNSDTVQPNAIYQAHRATPLSEQGRDSLSVLYQPIIGADALAVYFALNSDAQIENPKEYTHLDLLNLLNFGLARFMEARYRLEGIGLVTVYRKKTERYGDMYGYELQEPLTPQAFFEDTTYSFLLTSMVGERRFTDLVQRYQPKQWDWQGYQDISKKFTDIYQLDFTHFSKIEADLTTVSKQFEQAVPSLENTLDESLDWAFLIFHASKKQISKSNFTQKFSEKLSLFHRLYGYDEMELVQFMAQVVNLSDGLVDEQALDKAIVAYRTQQKNQAQRKIPEVVEENQVRRFNTLRQTGFSEADIETIKESEALLPLDYFEAIKEAKHSFSTKLEEWIVRNLVETSSLTNSVINILLHYVLVIQNHSILPQKVVEKIAADWSERRIANPEDAIKRVRQMVQDIQTEQAQRTTQKQARYTTKGQPIRKEVLPKWMEAQQVATSEEKQEIEAELKLSDEVEQKFQEYLRRKKEGET